MKISLILAHPAPGSFNHAIAAAVDRALRDQEHTVWFHDLYAERFDPLMTAAELARNAELPAAIEAHLRELEQADGLVIVHPNWWGAPPAILRGWVDRVLRPGRAYRFVPDGQGGARPEGLLPLQAALVFTTANTPQDQEERLYGDPLESHWIRVVFGMCGVPRVQRRSFSPVITSTPELRRQWLKEAAELAAELVVSAQATPEQSEGAQR
jgi:NAD(P)H dehydrogenase (quinone)